MMIKYLMNNGKMNKKTSIRDMIKYYSENITIIDASIDSSSFKVQRSLFQLIKSNYFTMDMILIYLEKRNESGIVDYLINSMHQSYINESFFYLSQICIMITYKPYIASIEDYILDKCVNHLKFSLTISLLLRSYPQNPKIQSMIFHIEESIINGSRSTTNLMRLSNPTEKCCSLKKEFSVSDTPTTQKDSRVYYYFRCMEFYDNLKVLCELLYQYPVIEESEKLPRKKVLDEFIKLFNSELELIRKDNYTRIQDDIAKNNSDLILNKGYLLPISNPKSNLDSDSYIIVNFVPYYSRLFSTKERVPIKFCCECIETNECNQFYDLYLDTKFFEEANGKNIFESVSCQLTKQLSLFVSKKQKIFDKFANLEKFLKENKQIADEKNNANKAKTPPVLLEKTSDDYVVIDFNPEIFNPFGKPQTEIENELRMKSKFKKFKTYSIKNFIAKANDDLKQEMFAMQIIKKFKEILIRMGIYVSTYEILITSETSGLIEFLPNTSSIDNILKSIPSNWNLNKFFRNYFTSNYAKAQENFADSLAGFCLLSYYLQIKDRHNGNILIDDQGRINHIDFGFILGATPKNLYFEKAPFKLTQDYVDILDGFDSLMFKRFKFKLIKGLIECKKNYEVLNTILIIMSHSQLKCYQYQVIEDMLKNFQQRFLFGYKEKDIEDVVNRMIIDCYENFWTKKYDYFQYLANGISY